MRRPRTVFGVVLAVVLYATIGSSPTEASRAKKVPCREDISNCPAEGCGTDFDPNLNKRKNIRPERSTSGRGCHHAHSDLDEEAQGPGGIRERRHTRRTGNSG